MQWNVKKIMVDNWHHNLDFSVFQIKNNHLVILEGIVRESSRVGNSLIHLKYIFRSTYVEIQQRLILIGYWTVLSQIWFYVHTVSFRIYVPMTKNTLKYGNRIHKENTMFWCRTIYSWSSNNFWTDPGLSLSQYNSAATSGDWQRDIRLHPINNHPDAQPMVEWPGRVGQLAHTPVVGKFSEKHS